MSDFASIAQWEEAMATSAADARVARAVADRRRRRNRWRALILSLLLIAAMLVAAAFLF